MSSLGFLLSERTSGVSPVIFKVGMIDPFQVAFPTKNYVLRLEGRCHQVCLTDLAVVSETLEPGLVRCFGP